jgi:hypothetical protein
MRHKMRNEKAEQSMRHKMRNEKANAVHNQEGCMHPAYCTLVSHLMN